jgi:hypothetical protein
LKDPTKLTQIGFFGLKINHLATLACSRQFLGDMLMHNDLSRCALQGTHQDLYQQK